MAYLTYNDYIELGGNVDMSAFPLLEKQARRKLDYYTQNRLQTTNIIIDEVKEVMTMFINHIYSFKLEQFNLKSYSNGVETFNFDLDKTLDDELYYIAVEYLPLELIYIGVC